jgi:hypothetical protein
MGGTNIMKKIRIILLGICLTAITACTYYKHEFEVKVVYTDASCDTIKVEVVAENDTPPKHYIRSYKAIGFGGVSVPQELVFQPRCIQANSDKVKAYNVQRYEILSYSVNKIEK